MKIDAIDEEYCNNDTRLTEIFKIMMLGKQISFQRETKSTVSELYQVQNRKRPQLKCFTDLNVDYIHITLLSFILPLLLS